MQLNPKNGEKFGASDGGAPQAYTNEALSRLMDTLNSAEKAGLDKNTVFASAPTSMRMEYVYSSWTYVEG